MRLGQAILEKVSVKAAVRASLSTRAHWSAHSVIWTESDLARLHSSTAYLLSIIAGAALVFSVILLLLVRAFTKIILEVTLFLSVVVAVAYAVYLWIVRYYSGAQVVVPHSGSRHSC